MDTTKTAPERDAAPSAPQRPAPQAPAQSPEQSRSARIRSPRFRMFLILGAVLLAVVGFFLWRYFSSYEATDDAQIDGHVNSVSARVSGHVVKLNVEDNQYVEKGTVLVEIDPADYEVAVAQARADYADAQAQASAAGINVPVTDVSTAGQVTGAQANVSSA